MNRIRRRAKTGWLILLLAALPLTGGCMSLDWDQAARGVWHVEGLGASMIFLTDTQNRTTV